MNPSPNYFLVKVQFMEEVNDKMKKVKRDFLVNAMSVTEAEAKVIADFAGCTFDFEVKSVNSSKIIKIIE